MGGKNSGQISIVDKVKTALSRDYNTPLEEMGLTDEEVKAMERIEFVHNLMRSRAPIHPNKEIMNLTRNQFDISQSQYYLDKHNAQKIFGLLDKSDRAYKRNIYSEWLDEAMAKAFEKNDYKAFASLMKNQIALLGLDKEDQDPDLNDTPRDYELILQVKVNEEVMEQKYDLMELNKLPPTELKALIDTSTAPRVDVEKMEELLDKNE